MDRVVFIALLFTFLFVQLASSQLSGECVGARSTLVLSNCTFSLADNRNLSTICGAECRTLHNNFFDQCEGEDDADLEMPIDQERILYNHTCSVECGTAVSSLESEPQCLVSLDPDQDEIRQILCSNECQPFYVDVFAGCSLVRDVQNVTSTVNDRCGGQDEREDGGAGLLKGLGIYSLLLVSLAAALI